MSCRSVYVYYRVPAARLSQARALVDALHARLERAVPGLSARLMTRADVAAQMAAQTAAQMAERTWMEVYDHVDGLDDTFFTALRAAEDAVLAPAAASGLIGMRHTEVFEPVPRVDALDLATGPAGSPD